MTTTDSPIDETPRPFLRFSYRETGGWLVQANIRKPDGSTFEVVPCVTGADSEQEAREYAALVLPQVYEPGTTFEVVGATFIEE